MNPHFLVFGNSEVKSVVGLIDAIRGLKAAYQKEEFPDKRLEKPYYGLTFNYCNLAPTWSPLEDLDAVPSSKPPPLMSPMRHDSSTSEFVGDTLT
jgi:hypothetical protein